MTRPMKPILATTACFITATVVCAHISNEELAGLSDEPQPIVQVTSSNTTVDLLGGFSPSMYGVFGAAAMALMITTRRQNV